MEPVSYCPMFSLCAAVGQPDNTKGLCLKWAMQVSSYPYWRQQKSAAGQTTAQVCRGGRPDERKEKKRWMEDEGFGIK